MNKLLMFHIVKRFINEARVRFLGFIGTFHCVLDLRSTKFSMIIIPLLVVTVAFHRVPIEYNQPQSEPQEVIVNTSKLETEVPLFSEISQRFYTQYEAHDPIYIDGNSDFSLTAEVESWPGDGSETNPYTIAELHISDPTDNLIEIKNTDVHFRISSCQLIGGYIGIWLFNVTNGNLTYNTIADNRWHGIYLKLSENSTLSNNIVNNNSGGGISLEYSRYSSLTTNTVNNNREDGISLEYSGYSTLTNNTVTNNSLWGTYLYYSSNSLLADNNVTNNGEAGFYIYYSADCTLTNNIVTNNSLSGIYLWSSRDNNLVNNTITNNSGDGISLTSSGNTTLTNNIVTNSSENGISLSTSENTILTTNTIINNSRDGITLEDSGNSILTNNTVTNNSRNGICLWTAGNGTLTNNTVTNNSVDGISLWTSVNGTLTTNTVTNNSGNGISLWTSGNSTLTSNTVTNNSGEGISLWLWSGNSTLTSNVVTNNRGNGISLWFSGNNAFLDNILVNNGFYVSGVQLKHYLQAVVTNNSVNNKPLVYWQNITGGTVPSGVGQVVLVNSSFVEVTGQIIMGLQGVYCSNLFIHNNTIINGINGIHLFWTNNSIVSGNNIINTSHYGIYIDQETIDNRVEFNNFYGNHVDGSQAYDSGLSNLFQYNYWDDWVTPDNNTDGYVDIPYSIAGEANNQDLFPRIMDLVILFPNEQLVLSGFVTIEWTTGHHLFGEPVTYSVYYSPDGGTTWYHLESDLIRPSYVWDTTLVANGANYLLKVVATTTGGTWQAVTFSSQFSINNISPTLTSSSSTITPTNHSQTSRDSDILAILQIFGLLSILAFSGILFVTIRRRG
ncbi:MAG: right-handed parallel beta-helix repeat-containing protein [Candidatus Heimdallarchaeota archaeon]|nr:MAG: right-handed parallel beta-helix repeat-containing protein [Candidatus Heimdallarchaeota archaeon]